MKKSLSEELKKLLFHGMGLLKSTTNHDQRIYMPSKITFYGGVHEIGGNKFLLEDKGTKIFLDFGMQMGKANQYFAEFVNPFIDTVVEKLLEIAIYIVLPFVIFPIISIQTVYSQEPSKQFQSQLMGIKLLGSIDIYSKYLPEVKKVIDSIEFFPVQNPVTKTPSSLNMNETEESIPETSIDNNPSGLQILSHNSFTDSIGYLHIVGEIKNNYPSTATFVKIVGTFYDVNNIVVGTQFTYANPSDISSGQKAPFELILTSVSIPISQIDHYNLQVSYQ